MNRDQLQPIRGRSAFDWDVYKDRKSALQYLKRHRTLVDTVIETEDGSAHELVHSQVISAFGDKLTQFIETNGTYLPAAAASAGPCASGGASIQPIVPPRPPPSPSPPAATGATSANSHDATPPPPPPPAASNSSRHLVRSQDQLRRIKWVRLPGFNRYTLGILIECAYTGYIRTDLGSGGIWQVLEVADHYEMTEVIRACCTFLIKNLTGSNCIHFYHIGIKHRHPLQRCAWHKIRANFKHILAQNLLRSSQDLVENGVLSSSLMKSLTSSPFSSSPSPSTTTSSALHSARGGAQHQQQHQQHQQRQRQRRSLADEELEQRRNNLATIKYEHFEPLLMHDKLNIDNEESVWYAIKLWCNYDLAERASKVANLLPCMRFPRFRTGTEFSGRHIWRDPLVANDKQAQHQLAILDRNHRDYLAGGGSLTGGGGGSGSGASSSSAAAYSSSLLGPSGSFSTSSSAATSSASASFRDGFHLPCAVSPRQLRPRIPHSILLAIGGWQRGQPTTLIESYDANCNMWFENKRRIMAPLAYHGIEYIHGLLYICGGTDGSEILNELFTFDPVRGDCSQKASMHEARCYVSTAHLGGHLYAMGGHNGVSRMRSVERFNLAEESWQTMADMNVARSDASACVYGAHIYIAGGLNDQSIEASVEFYNAADNTWTFISSMLTQRTSFTLLTYQDSLLAIGGNNGSERLASVEQYHFATRQWSPHSQMRHRRSTFSAALLDGTKLIVVGGYNGQTPFSQVEMYDHLLGQWATLANIRYDRSGLKVVVVEDLPNAAEYTFMGSQAAEPTATSYHHQHHQHQHHHGNNNHHHQHHSHRRSRDRAASTP